MTTQQRHTILIVDDQIALGDAFAEILDRQGYQVRRAENYGQAMNLIDADVDLALLDIRLAGRSGIDVLTHIREHYPDCPAIMMSGYADKENIIDALRLGAVEYFEKLLNPSELLHSIEHWIDFRSLKQENARLQDFKTMHDRLKASEEQTRKDNERLNFLLTSTSAVIYACTTDALHATTYISDNIARLSGFAPEAFLDDPEFRLQRIHPDDRRRIDEALERIEKLGHGRIEYRFLHRDGHYFWIGDEMRIESDELGRREILGFMSDITRLKNDEERIRHMAYTDLLTGLPNRTLYYDRLKQAIVRARRNQQQIAVLFMDLDYFKPINDELGHEWGDKALIEVAYRLQTCIRESDTVARVGGDEFSIVLSDISDEAAACKIAEKIIDSIRQPMQLGGRTFTLGASVGIHIEAEDYSDAETFMRLADDAMYVAKEAGRNRYHLIRGYDIDSATAANQAHHIEIALHQAIEKNELCVHYQPKLDMDQQEVIGLHALLRWDRGDDGIYYPGQFLDIATRSGLITQIGEWVLRHVCTQNRAWRDAGRTIVPISINVTSDQLRLPGFARLVDRVLIENGLPAEMLEMEISESEFMQHGMAIAECVNDISKLGVKLTVDNFGSGFFSLQALKLMPVSELKLNRDLVHQLGRNSSSEQIANAVIAMGHILNHQVIAEGVETLDQLDFLRRHETDGMLGFLTSPAVPPEEIVERLKQS